MGLDLPPLIQLRDRLRENGFDFPAEAIDMGAIRRGILRTLGIENWGNRCFVLSLIAMKARLSPAPAPF